VFFGADSFDNMSDYRIIETLQVVPDSMVEYAALTLAEI